MYFSVHQVKPDGRFFSKKSKFSLLEAARVFGMHPADFQRVAKRWGYTPERDESGRLFYHRSDLVCLYNAVPMEVRQ